MEQSLKNNTPFQKWFLVTGLMLLLFGMVFGIIGGLQYIIPGFLKAYLSFDKTRPIHVSSVVFWILFAATGSVLFYLQQMVGKKFYSLRLVKIQWILFVSAITLILICYFNGVFGGREYWEFPPVLAILIILAWLFFAINVVKSIGSFKNQPVYVWMWLTGGVGFLFIFTESYLWLLPYFQKDVVRDMTVQWKSYGSMVGCWNMLVYGAGFYLMEKISDDKSYAQSKIAFALFFLGFFNLLFNWSHHIYTLPISGFIKHTGYLVSMTELLILGRIIYKWKSSVTQAQKFNHLIAYRFLLAADIWVFINLTLAILMSIPAINIYTHGTHITVAHVMGTTIGINTMILMAVSFDILQETCQGFTVFTKSIARGFWLANLSLLVFLFALVGAGIERSRWQMSDHPIAFSLMMKGLVPYFIVFTISGFLIFVGFAQVITPLVRNFMKCYFNRNTSTRKAIRVHRINPLEGKLILLKGIHNGK